MYELIMFMLRPYLPTLLVYSGTFKISNALFKYTREPSGVLYLLKLANIINECGTSVLDIDSVSIYNSFLNSID